MLTNNPKISSLRYNDAVSRLAEGKHIGIDEARSAIASMSFGDYHRLIEATADIVPPSGKIISPQQQAQKSPQAPQAGQAPATPGQPIQTIKPGIQPPAPVPGQPVQPPIAGQALQQQAQQFVPPGSKVPVVPGQPIQPGQEQTEESSMLQRLRELAGIGEDCSSGATGAGSIATAPISMGKMKKRPPVEESPSLEHPVAGRKTVVGATGPQASAIGKLSANNAVRGNPTPFRKKNGLKE